MKQLLVALFSLLLASEAFAQPTLSKVFTPNTIGPGSVSTITFTLTNGSASPVTGLAFTDVLPTVPGDVDIASPANASTTCDLGVSGTLTAPDGGGTITLSDAQIGGSSSCTVTVDVTADTPGVHTNPAVTLSSSAGSSMSLAVDLTVDTSLPGFSKSFAPSSVPLGGRSTLTLTIDNSANASNVLNLDFADTLPTGMVIADPANASTTCGTAVLPPTLTADAGTSLIVLDANGTFAFPSVAAGAICTVTVDVKATASGSLNNISNDLLASFVSAGKASATLEVSVTPLAIQKAFTDDPTPPGGNVTLEFALDNFDRIFPATGVAFTDDLTTLVPALAGLTYDSLLFNDCGGSVAGVGGTAINFSGGTIAPESSCVIRVSLAVPAAVPGVYTNTTSAISGTVDGAMVVGNMASDDLFVAPVPVLTKEFLEDGTLLPDPVVDAGAADTDVVLRFTVTNTSTTSSATDVEFIDELTDGSSDFPPDPTSGFLPFPVSVVLPAPPVCGTGTVVLVSRGTDRQALELTGGTLAAAGMAGDSCTFDVTVTIPQGFAPGVYINNTEEPTATVDGETRVGKPTSDTLSVVGAPVLAKSFTDDPVGPGGTVTLEFDLSYGADASGDATGINFSDDLTTVFAGLVATSVDTNTCTGASVDIGTDPTNIDFSGGSMMPGDTCTVSLTLDVPMGTLPGTYPNTTSDVAATVGGLAVTSPSASDDLKVTGLVFSKEFLTSPVIAGDTTTLRFTIDNIHPTDDATITFFTDNLQAELTGLAATGGPSFDDCGGALAGTTFLTYIGGSVMSGMSCTIDVEVLVPLAAADGIYTNITSSLSANQGGPIGVDPAVDQLVVNSNLLQLTKAFTDDPVAPGDSVTLEFTLTNLDAGLAASAIAFSDNLGAALSGLTFDSVLFDDCGGVVTGAGTDMIGLTGASLAAGGSCTIRVSLSVPAGAAANIYTNMTSSVTGTIDGFAVTGDAASDDLEVIQLLSFSKSFDGPTTATGTAILTFTITNPGPDTAIGLEFSDNLDDVITGLIATSLPAVPCGPGSSIAGISFLTFTGGELPPMGGMCSFDVEVMVPASATAGTFPNTTSELFQSGLEVSEPATADLTIEPPPTFAKSFSPDTIFADSVSTLSFTIDNSASAVAASGLAFTDNLPAGVSVSTPSITANTCGGTLTATAGAATISLTGGSVGAGSTCTIDVDVTSAVEGMYANTTGDLTSSSGNSGTASDTLTVNAAVDVSITKTDGVTSATPGDSVTYTIVAANAGPSTDPSVSLTDTFPAVLSCTWTSVAAGGATGNTAAGAGDLAETLSLPAASSVTYTVTCDIDSDATGTLSNTATVTPSIYDTNGANHSATDSDTVLSPAADISVTKTDGVTSAIPGGSLTYTIVATNAGPSVDPSVSLTDTFPAVLTCTWTSIAAGGATGNTAAGAGDLAETLSMPVGSSVTYTATCTIDSAATGTLSNTATVSASVTDNNSGNNSATDADTVLEPEADVSVTKDDGVSDAVPGQTILNYTIVAANAGPSVDTSVSLTDSFPADLSCTWTSIAAGGATGNTAAGSTDLAEALSMPAGSSVTYTVACDIDPSATGSLSNTATVLGTASDPDSSNNSATDNNTLSPEADLSVAKSTGVSTVYAGSNITYTLEVTNNGPSDSSGGEVIDVLPAGLSFVSSASGCTEAAGTVTCPFGPLPVGNSTQMTFVALVTLTENGSIRNVVTVSGNEPNPNAGAQGVNDITVWAVFTPIPTLSGWMLLLMTILLGGIGLRGLRRAS